MEIFTKKRKLAESPSDLTPEMQQEMLRLMVQSLYDSGFP